MPKVANPTDYTEYFIQVEESYFENDKLPGMASLEKGGGRYTPIQTREHAHDRVNKL